MILQMVEVQHDMQPQNAPRNIAQYHQNLHIACIFCILFCILFCIFCILIWIAYLHILHISKNILHIALHIIWHILHIDFQCIFCIFCKWFRILFCIFSILSSMHILHILNIYQISHILHFIHICVFYSANWWWRQIRRLGCQGLLDWWECTPQGKPLVPKRSLCKSHHVKRRFFRHSNQHMPVEPLQCSTLNYTLPGWRWHSQRGYHALRWEMILHRNSGEMGKYAVLTVLPDKIAHFLYCKSLWACLLSLWTGVVSVFTTSSDQIRCNCTIYLICKICTICKTI